MDVTVIIRAAGERTLDLCRGLVERQVSVGQVQVIQVAPFEAALRQCYEKGIEAGAKWTLTLDADVLVRPAAIAELVSCGDSADGQVFHLQGRVYDKLLLCDRIGGLRLYRTAVLPQLLARMPQPGTALRPECDTILAVQQRGWQSVALNSIHGLHDFEQYYGDVYRKAMLHAHKHLESTGALVPRWKQLARKDPDYLMAMKGYYDGLQSDAAPLLDMRTFQDRGKMLQELGLSEKGPLARSVEEVLHFEALVERIIRQHSSWLGRSRNLVNLYCEVRRERGLRYALRRTVAWTAHYGTSRLHALGSRIDRERT